MAETFSYRRQFTTVPDSFGPDFSTHQICVRFVIVMSETLYDEDFYAWTQQQADLLRRLRPAGNELDLEHIAEEIEDLGRSDLRAAQSLCEHVIEHFLKLEYSGLEQPADHWRDEIVEWRLQLEKILTRSIEAKLDLPARYRAALRLLRRLERDLSGFASRLPAECPYALEQIVSSGDEDWFPAPR
jgi:DNA-binding PucR family transcriptional regulator